MTDEALATEVAVKHLPALLGANATLIRAANANWTQVGPEQVVVVTWAMPVLASGEADH
jgi:hypothetical protein